MNELNNKIESLVMENIKSGRVKLRSKYIFLAEKLGLGSAVVLSVLIAILFFNLALFYLKTSDNLVYLSFGSLGIFAFLESFPYLLVVSLIIFIFIAGYLVKRTEIAYQKPFGYLALGLVAFIIIGGASLAFTNIAEQIEEQTFETRVLGGFFRPFLEQGAQNHKRGLVGRIVDAGEGYVEIQTPYTIEKLELDKINDLDKDILQIGNMIIAIGDRKERNFEAVSLRLIDQDSMPMIRRGIHRRFGSFCESKSDTFFDKNCVVPNFSDESFPSCH